MGNFYVDEIVKSEESVLAEKTEQILAELCNKNASLFTVGELFWIQYHINKIRWSTTLDYEKKLFKEFNDFLKEIEEKEKNT